VATVAVQGSGEAAPLRLVGERYGVDVRTDGREQGHELEFVVFTLR
jgi:hypothetical protein